MAIRKTSTPETNDAAEPAAESSFEDSIRRLGEIVEALENGELPLEESLRLFEEGVKLAPSSPEMHFALARAYTRAGRKEDAARERETFKKLQDEYNQKRQIEEKP